jgi:class 3 adenylate cyclase/tetratricopeptide (TPR) repeat protein
VAPNSARKPIEILQWLRELGLEQYTDAFRNNAIDAKILPTLTADDLRDIGVTLVGHRRRLLNAIAELNTEPSPTGPAPAAPEGQAPERRQLSVMFCDLVGSTALSTKLDPEDLRTLVGAYHRAVKEAVVAYDGFVAKYMGDGVLVYFGYPRAHEDDAERAIRAGLQAIDAVGRLDAKSDKLQARVGIATGFVVVGDLIGEGSAQEQAVVGETPNLAARLQALAAPGRVVIAAGTRQQIGELFDLEDLGPQQLAGFADPQPTWMVLRESTEVSRFDALHAETAPLVGRDEELEVLLRRWESAKRREGRVVLISGEPGIGKSRLTAALSEQIGAEPHARWRFFCSPHHQDSALYPFITHLERAAGFVRDDGTEEKLKKLRALAAPTQTEDDVALMAELLSLPARPAAPDLDPQRRREKLFEALLKQLEAEVRHRPVLMIFEDAHWIDPTSREMLDLTIERMRRLPVMLAITFRPEFQAPWGGGSHVTSLMLNRLNEANGEVLVQSLAGRVGLDAEIVTKIVERADGVPLFLEELTKTVLESVKDRGAAAVAPSGGSSGGFAVPATLHASLVARLDRLAAASKEVAQVGAVLGREFSYSLIRPVAQCDETTLQAALAQLSEAELLFCRGAPPHASYLFKHALVQDAAYSTLLRGKRQELHARVATVLERDFADQVEHQPELLAHHLSAAGDVDRSIGQWLKAARYAAARSAYREAIRHFERGLAMLATLPETPARDGREIELQLALGSTLFSAEGFASARAAAAYARARDLAEQQGNSRQQFMTVYGLWQLANGGGKIHDCQRLSTQLQKLTNDDDELRLQAHHSGWATRLFAGEPAAALEHSVAGRRLYDVDQHRHHREIYGGHDPGMCAHYLGAHALWTLGRPDRALELGKEALAMGERIAHPFSHGLALQYTAMLHLDRCEPEPALELLDTVEALAAEHRMGLVLDLALLRGAALILLGAAEQAAGHLREALHDPAAAPRLRCYGLAKLSEALTRQGDCAAALAVAEDGLKVVEETGHRQWMAELYRLKGSALSGLDRLQESQNAFEDALRIAQGQGAKAYELRAAMSLSQLWGEQGRRAEAHDLLAPTYGWFAEGFGTADLKEAKSLLGQLA